MSTIEPTRAGSNATSDTFAFPEPVTHGAGISFHYDDTGLYDQMRDLWRSEVSDPENQPATVATYDPDFLDRSGDFALRLRSSRWKAGMDTGANGWRQWYKYHLTLKERVTCGSIRISSDTSGVFHRTRPRSSVTRSFSVK